MMNEETLRLHIGNYEKSIKVMKLHLNAVFAEMIRQIENGYDTTEVRAKLERAEKDVLEAEAALTAMRSILAWA